MSIFSRIIQLLITITVLIPSLTQAAQIFSPENVHEYYKNASNEYCHNNYITRQQALCYQDRFINEIFIDSIITLISTSILEEAKKDLCYDYILEGIEQKKLVKITADIFHHLKGWHLNKKKLEELALTFINCSDEDEQPAALGSFIPIDWAPGCVVNVLIVALIDIWKDGDNFFTILGKPYFIRYITTIKDHTFINFWQNLTKIDCINNLLREEFEYSNYAGPTLDEDGSLLCNRAQDLYTLIAHILVTGDHSIEPYASLQPSLFFPAEGLIKIITMLQDPKSLCKSAFLDMACPIHALMNMLASEWINQNPEKKLAVGIDEQLFLLLIQDLGNLEL